MAGLSYIVDIVLREGALVLLKRLVAKSPFVAVCRMFLVLRVPSPLECFSLLVITLVLFRPQSLSQPQNHPLLSHWSPWPFLVADRLITI